VIAFFRSIHQGRGQWLEVNETKTDEDGGFRITGRPGTYLLAAGPGVYAYSSPAVAERPKGYSQVFYPNEAKFSTAGEIVVAGGQQVRADFLVSRQALFSLSGEISGMSKGEKTGAVELENESGETLSFASNVEENKFEIRGVPPGSYRMTAVISSQRGESGQADLPMNVTSDIAGINLVVTSAATIPIETERIETHPDRDRNQTSFLEGSVAASPIREMGVAVQELPVRVILHPKGLLRSDLQSGPYEAGTVITDVKPGRYSVEIDPPGDWYVQSAQQAGVDLLRDDLVVRAGGKADPIHVVLRDDCSSLSGTVGRQTGKVVNGMALAVPTSAPLSPVAQTLVRGDGEFQFSCLAPGEYSILAFDQGDGLEYNDPTVLERFIDNAVQATLHSSEEARVSVEMTHRGD